MPSMFLDKKGKTRVQWVHDGRRKSRSFQSPKEAKLFHMKLEMGEIDIGQASSPTFRDFAKIWIRDYCKVEKCERLWREDEAVITRHLLPALAAKKLIDLSKADLVMLKSDLSKKESVRGGPLSPKTVNNILGLAKKMLNTAVDMEYLTANPWQAVRPLKAQASGFDFWTPEERDQFLAHNRMVNEAFARLVCFACHTGLRLGELAGLKRRDLDLRSKMVHVRGQYSMMLGKRVEHTKGKRAEQVPLNAIALSAVSHAWEFSPEESVFDLSLFHNARRQLRKYAVAAKVKPIRFHDLRHSFASCLAMAGVDLMKIQQLMRHKTYQMTLRYAHLHPDHLIGATDVLVHAECTRETYPQLPTLEALEEWRTLSDSNARPSGSKHVA